MGDIERIAKSIIATGSMDEHRRLCRVRDEAISKNRSLRMRGQPTLPVPPKPAPPMGYEIYIDDVYEGFCPHDDESEAIVEGKSIADGGKVSVKRRRRTR